MVAPTTERVTALDQELHEDLAVARSDGLAQADLEELSETEIFRTEKIPPTPPIASDTPAIEKKTMRQFRTLRDDVAASLRISLPTFRHARRGCCYGAGPRCGRFILGVDALLGVNRFLASM